MTLIPDGPIWGEQVTPPLPAGRVRSVGGGRKRSRDKVPAMVEALERSIAPDTRGDPMSPLRWTCKSTRHLAEALEQQGFTASHRLVGEVAVHTPKAVVQCTRQFKKQPENQGLRWHFRPSTERFM